MVDSICHDFIPFLGSKTDELTGTNAIF